MLVLELFELKLKSIRSGGLLMRRGHAARNWLNFQHNLAFLVGISFDDAQTIFGLVQFDVVRLLEAPSFRHIIDWLLEHVSLILLLVFCELFLFDQTLSLLNPQREESIFHFD